MREEREREKEKAKEKEKERGRERERDIFQTIAWKFYYIDGATYNLITTFQVEHQKLITFMPDCVFKCN